MQGVNALKSGRSVCCPFDGIGRSNLIIVVIIMIVIVDIIIIIIVIILL